MQQQMKKTIYHFTPEEETSLLKNGNIEKIHLLSIPHGQQRLVIAPM